VNGVRGRTGPSARTAVPVAMNSHPCAVVLTASRPGNGLNARRTPTTPSAPCATHSSRIRPSAVARRWTSTGWRSGSVCTGETATREYWPQDG
jgi:hypothetical protein